MLAINGDQRGPGSVNDDVKKEAGRLGDRRAPRNRRRASTLVNFKKGGRGYGSEVRDEERHFAVTFVRYGARLVQI